jgi:hypothetical protein
MKKPNIKELDRLYIEAEQVDQELFSEMRTNTLLVSGDHYSKRTAKWWNRLRENRELSSEVKLRLTKNHVNKIMKTHINAILSQSPGVRCFPNNEKEMQDQKSAELNQAVWENAKHRHNIKLQTQHWCTDFVQLGEVAVKVSWDPAAGRFLGYMQATNEDGEDLFEENGSPCAAPEGVFSGDLVFERLTPFNLLRAPEAKRMDDSPYLIYRKMVYTRELQKQYEAAGEEITAKIQSSQDETFMVFDAVKGIYHESKDQTMVREFYYRPCVQYPQGYFYITLKEVILAEGELPYGIFPIRYEGDDEIVTTPRHRSLIRQLRPFQMEINRAASKMAEHQVTLGDDKIILTNGSKITGGPTLPGIRAMYVQGMPPTILPGRTGEQYLPYMQSQVEEMYRVAGIPEELDDKNQAADPYANLYKSMRERKKFSLRAEKFENFLRGICETYLELAKEYFDQNNLVPAIGKSEYINIEEFKTAEPLQFRIKVEPMSDDIDSKMGKHLAINHLLQYVGSNLEKDDIGKLAREMPFLNDEAMFDDLTQNYDSAKNIMLMIERGEKPGLGKYDDVGYIGKRLSSRMKASDFAYLDPMMQQMYGELLTQCEEIGAQQLEELKKAQDQFIPSGGARIKIDYYVPDPKNPNRPVRATAPAESIDWLLERLAAQGSGLDKLQQQDQGVQADIAAMLLQQGQQPPPQEGDEAQAGVPQAPQGVMQ